MRVLRLHRDSRSIEEMLKYIANQNQIKQFEFVIYEQYPADSNEPLEEALTSEIEKKIIIDATNIPPLSSIKKHEDSVVGITSKVIYKDNLRGHLKHLDMDFTYEQDVDKYTKPISEFLENMHPKEELYEGFLVFSGNGFHYHGTEILPHQEWVVWMKEASIPNKVTNWDVDTLVSPRWSEIQLEKGFSILRLTSSELKPEEPKVFYKVDTHKKP